MFDKYFLDICDGDREREREREIERQKNYIYIYTRLLSVLAGESHIMA